MPDLRTHLIPAAATILVAAACAAPSASDAPDAATTGTAPAIEVTTKTFNSTALGVAVDYRAGWQAEAVPGGLGLQSDVAQVPSNGALPDNATKIELTQGALDPPDLDAWAERVIQEHISNMQDVLVAERITLPSGYQAVLLRRRGDGAVAVAGVNGLGGLTVTCFGNCAPMEAVVRSLRPAETE